MVIAMLALVGLMPQPAHVEPKNGSLVLDSTFRIEANVAFTSAAKHFETQLARQTGLVFVTDRPAHAKLVLSYKAFEGADESYTLDVDGQGARIDAPTRLGVLRGLATFAQLVEACPQGWCVAAVHIEDRPRFAWRGLMIDVSRHWIPLDAVKRNLDAMAAVKLNVFHWHLSDDQGFRVESKRFPLLQKLGSDGHYYTQEEVREVVRYAHDLGIRVVPEFDMPGHTLAWMVGYPQLGSAPGPFAIGRKWGIYDEALDPTKESTYKFVGQLLDEMIPLFPDKYFHIGGDEVKDTQWKASASIQAFAKQHGFATSDELQGYFTGRVQAMLKARGKIMIGWDEVLRPGLASDTVIQSWRGQASLAQAAKQGYRGILSSGYYLDSLQPAKVHYANDPMGGDAAQLTAEQAARILGGEACMWDEYVSAETVDSRIWPRTAAIAERLWSQADQMNADSLYDRLERVSAVLEATGVRHRSALVEVADQIAGSSNSHAVQVLAQAVEATGIGGRTDLRPEASLVPLTSLVDAARPESEEIRHLQIVANHVAQGSGLEGEAAELRAAFEEWAAASKAAEQDSADRALADEMGQIAGIGLEALQYLGAKDKAPGNWAAEQEAVLAKLPKQTDKVRVKAIGPVSTLLEAVAR